MSHRRLLAIALIAGLPGFAGAQFTTFIPPKNRVADSVKAVVAAQQKAQVDSSIRMQITNMKAWVDSAAGLPPTPTTAPDSATALPALSPAPTAPSGAMRSPDSTMTSAPRTPAKTPARTPAAVKPKPTATVTDTTFHDGARAPATASSLPLFMLLGVLSLGAGVLLLRGGPTEARARADRRHGA